MAENEYLVPFGIDPRKFFEGLAAMEDGGEKLADNMVLANKEIAKSFEIASTAGEVLGKRMDEDAKKFVVLKDQAKGFGKELGGALNQPAAGKAFEDRINKVKKLMEETSKKGIKIPIDFNEAKLQKLEQMISAGADEFKILAATVDFAKEKLATLDAGSTEFAELSAQVNTAEEFLTKLGNTSDEVGNKGKSLKAQLRSLKEELAQMEQRGEENTEQFLKMSIAAGRVEDQIGDISARVRVLASDTKYIDAGVQAVTGLAGAFAAGQGAMALFGSENKTLNEVIQKTTGAMALLQGIQAVATALNKDSALSVLFFSRAQQTAAATTALQTGALELETGATVAATTATRTFTAALLANPITAVLVALAAIVAALIAFSSSSDDAEEATKKLNDELERQDEILRLDEANINRRSALNVARAKAEGKSESEITGVVKREEEQRLIIRQQALETTRDKLKDGNLIAKLSAEEYKKLQDREVKQEQEVLDLSNELKIKGIEQDSQRAKESEEIEKKRTETAKQYAAERKAIQDQEIKFRREYLNQFIEGLDDQYEKERQQAIAQTEQTIEDLQREKSLSTKAEREKNDLIIILRQNLTKKLKGIDEQRDKDRAQLLLEGQQKLAELGAAGSQTEIEILQLSYKQREKEINEQFKNEGALRVKLIAALRLQEAAEEKKIRDAAAVQALKDEEERRILEIETAAKFLGERPELERQKQLEVLKVKLEFAEKSLSLLVAQGNAENSTVVLQAKKTIQELQKQIGDASKQLKDKPFDIFEFLGLGQLTDAQKASVINSAKQALDSLRQITDFVVEQYQRQIEAKQKVIDQETDDITRLEDQLKQEEELRSQGLANNSDAIKTELDEKRRQREEDLKQQEDMQRRQRNLQKIQLALDTGVQASSLITSAANIFKTLSPLGPVGVGLAIGTIALMVGAFAAAKIKAFQAINEGQTQSFEGGGWIEDGKRHTQGGKKFRATDGSGDVVELESGEHVTRRGPAEKYSDLLDAINDDRLGTMTETALSEMLREMGISFSTPAAAQAVTMVRERDSLNHEISLQPGNDISQPIKNIDQNLAYLVEDKKFTPKHFQKDGYNFTTIGNNKISKSKQK